MAVPSSFEAGASFATREAWHRAAAQSSVRLQWDPDHHPSGAKLERRAIQLGLRGPMLEHYASESVVEIEDLSDFVADQRQHMQAGRYERLLTPREEVLAIDDPQLAARVGSTL